MARLFTAIEIPPDIGRDLELMRGGVVGARWLDAENFHITLRFLGEVDGGIDRELRSGLERIGGEPLDLQLNGLGFFGGRKPRSLWAGVADNPALRDLQSAHENLCQQIGLAVDPRKFTPHVTIARLRQTRANAVQSWLLEHSLYRSETFRAGRFVLMSSRPSHGGGPYVIEEAYPLTGNSP